MDEGYKELPRMSFWASPFGPLGRAKGLFIRVGTYALRGHEALVERGFSKASATLIVAAAGIVSVLAFVIVLAMVGGDDAHAHAA